MQFYIPLGYIYLIQGAAQVACCDMKKIKRRSYEK